MKKRILSCAITGVLATRKQCPDIPYTPEEIAQETKRAYDAGATIAHIHAREPNGKASWKIEHFREIKERARELSPILLNFSTGGIEGTIQDRARSAVELQPEIVAVNMGSMNYAIWSKKEKKFHFSSVFLNPFDEIQWLLEKANERKLIPELECFDAGHVCNATYFTEMGLLKAPLHFSLIMGVTGGIAGTKKCLENQVSILPSGSEFQVIGIGREQWQLGEWGLELGGHLRVGLEDNFYLPDGTMAKSNAELCEAGVALMKRHGVSPMNLAETRAALGR
jgi:3-keto-5-aminohexanoate cleavage enzyme